MRLYDLIDRDLLNEMIDDCYIRTQDHPDLPLEIYNYTEKAQYENVWNAATLQCRGLIVDALGNVVARPFAKFFNHSEPSAPALDLHEPAIVTDKLDGSLGILYPTPDGHAIATRGSFASEQALHATKVWQERYADVQSPPNGVTWLFEIVYPENRIVVDYGDMDDLVYLGAINNASGQWMPPEFMTDWPGPRAETFVYRTLGDALAAPPRDNAEGLVVYFPRTGERVKLKYEAYVALHRIVTGLNARTVWQHIVDGKIWEDLLDGLPDEFHGFVEDVSDYLDFTVNEAVVEIEREFSDLLAAMPGGFTRKDFADRAKKSKNAWGLFMKLDGKDILPKLWQNVKPEANWTPNGRSYNLEEAA